MKDVLSRMDRAAEEFHSYSAQMKRVQFTAVLGDSSESTGTVLLRRTKKDGTVGVVEFQKPDPRKVYIKGKTVQVLYPKAKTVEIYDTSKYTSNMDQILLLGFGTSAEELNKTYLLKDGGVDKINGTDTTRIELTPKSDEMKKLITKIDMWIAAGQSTPVRVKFSEPSKNYELVDYSETKLNPALPESAFKQEVPAGFKRIKPQQ
jgi:outer membrane lipoprotein-sorting protein